MHLRLFQDISICPLYDAIPVGSLVYVGEAGRSFRCKGMRINVRLNRRDSIPFPILETEASASPEAPMRRISPFISLINSQYHRGNVPS